MRSEGQVDLQYTLVWCEVAAYRLAVLLSGCCMDRLACMQLRLLLLLMFMAAHAAAAHNAADLFRTCQ